MKRVNHRIRAVYIPLLCLFLVCVAGCTTPDTEEAGFPGGGAAQVTLAIGAEAPSTRTSVDYTKEIRSVRIYAYRHSEAADARPVGYLYEPDVAANGPHYCTMSLDAAGEIDFYVLVNDIGVKAAQGSARLTENTTRGEMEAYQFQATSFQTMTDGSHAIPMSNLLTEGKSENDVDENNRTFRIVGKSAPQFIDVVVTRAMARVQLLFAKVGTEEITVDGATLYHGASRTWLTKEPTQEEQEKDNSFAGAANRTDEFLSEKVEVTTSVPVSNPEQKYQQVAETYMIENPYGETNNPDHAPTDHYTEAYRLGISYTAGGKQKTKQVYLPPVKRNQTIKVHGTLVANSLQVELEVTDWTVDDNTIDFSTDFNAVLSPGEPCRVVTGEGGTVQAIAVATSSGGTERGARFSFKMSSPVGVGWTAHLSSTVDFQLEGTASGVGAKDAEATQFSIVPKGNYNAASPQRVKLFVTLSSALGETDSGMQIINPKDQNGQNPYPGNETEIEIVQVAENTFDGLKQIETTSKE